MNRKIKGRILADHGFRGNHQRFRTRVHRLINPVAEAHDFAAVLQNPADPRLSTVHRADLLQHGDNL
ncbi:hypothetical protein D3C72_2313170 [compost metagenome]